MQKVYYGTLTATATDRLRQFNEPTPLRIAPEAEAMRYSSDSAGPPATSQVVIGLWVSLRE